jgi:hypothetical protein
LKKPENSQSFSSEDNSVLITCTLKLYVRVHAIKLKKTYGLSGVGENFELLKRKKFCTLGEQEELKKIYYKEKYKNLHHAVL